MYVGILARPLFISFDIFAMLLPCSVFEEILDIISPFLLLSSLLNAKLTFELFFFFFSTLPHIYLSLFFSSPLWPFFRCF